MADISIAEAKIQILYLAGEVPGVSYHMLMNKCMDSLLTDFFTFSTAYDELIAGNLMDREYQGGDMDALGGSEILTVTAGGRAVLSDLLQSMNTTVLEHLNKAAGELKEEKRLSLLVTATKAMTPDGAWKVELYSDNSGKPSSITLTVSNEDEASSICRAWKKSSGIIPDMLPGLICKYGED